MNRDSWLLVDIAHQGEVRMACVASGKPQIDHIYRFETAPLLTFTDALLRFERESGQRLAGLNLVVAIAGAAVGDSIQVVRNRWSISRTGLTAMMACPVTIINEVAAQAWATVDAMPAAAAIRGAGAPDLKMRSRHLFMTVDEGIGVAIIDVDERGVTTILEAEGGHIDFAPQTDRELALCRALSPLGNPVTFEQILMIKPADPAWHALGGLSDRERDAWRANILGRLVANLILATGAWHGAMMRGASLPTFHPATRAAFDTGFAERKSFHRLIGAARCWRVDQREPVLTGAAALMIQRTRTAHG